MSLILLLALFSSSASASDFEIAKPPPMVDISTVSASDKLRINSQISPNTPYAMTDKSLEKSAVGPGWTVVPLPAIVYNRNEGYWAGALAPIFRANDKGQVEDIFAPLYLHNDLLGETFTGNYFGYRNETQQYHVILSHATKIERTADLSYKDTAFGDGRYQIFLAANTQKSAFDRFFGFGPKTSEGNESNYTLGDSNVVASGGINLGNSMSILGTERYREVSIEDGIVSTLPQTLNAFPTAPGIHGADVWGQRLTVAYDTRDNQLTPLRGTYSTFYTENDQNYRTDNRYNWWRLVGETRSYYPNADDRAVFVWHAMIDTLAYDKRGLVPQGVPFYERPTLGGEDTLRAFGDGRYVSSAAYLINLEERISMVQKSIMGNVVELEVAPFIDIGRVAYSLGADDVVRDTQFNPGIGLRMLARPNVASRLDVAYGHDGFSAYVGLDYPF